MSSIKNLIIISVVILLISTSIFVIWIPSKNSDILETQNKIEEVSEKIMSREFTINQLSNQILKTSSSLETLDILQELNSPNQSKKYKKE